MDKENPSSNCVVIQVGGKDFETTKIHLSHKATI